MGEDGDWECVAAGVDEDEGTGELGADGACGGTVTVATGAGVVVTGATAGGTRIGFCCTGTVIGDVEPTRIVTVVPSCAGTITVTGWPAPVGVTTSAA